MNVYYKNGSTLHLIKASSDYDGDPVLAIMDSTVMIKEDKMPCTSAVLAVIDENKGKRSEEATQNDCA